MNNEKVSGSLPITRQNLSQSHHSISRPPVFARPPTSTQQSTIPLQATSSIASQPTGKTNATRAKAGWLASGRITLAQQLRIDLIKYGQNYNPHIQKDNRVAGSYSEAVRRELQKIKEEFEFGMSEKDRASLFRTMKSDVMSGYATNRYNTDAWTNPPTIAALRRQAVVWSKDQNNEIYAINADDAGIREFFRQLAQEIPAQYRQPALALIDRPPEYCQPLPETTAGILAASGDLPSAPEAQQAANASHSNTPSNTAENSAPSAEGKRPYSVTTSDPNSYGSQLPPFKRSRPAFESQTFPSSASHEPQASSSWSASNGMSGPDVQQQPQALQQPEMRRKYDSASTTYQPQLFESQQLAPMQSQFQSQPSSSWSASNGMSQSTWQPQQQQIAPSFDLDSATYDLRMFLGQSLDPAQSHSQPQSQPSSSSSASNVMSQLGIQQQQQQQQPQLPHIYNSGNMNYQTNVFEGGQYFGQSQFQPMPGTQNVSNSTLQTFQPSPHYQPYQNYQPLQTYQFNSSNATQGSNTHGPLPVAQPYNFYGASAQANPVVAHDAEWAQLLQTIDDMAPIAPATYTQSTPMMPMTAVNNQTTTESPFAAPAQRPGANG